MCGLNQMMLTFSIEARFASLLALQGQANCVCQRPNSPALTWQKRNRLAVFFSQALVVPGIGGAVPPPTRTAFCIAQAAQNG